MTTTLIKESSVSQLIKGLSLVTIAKELNCTPINCQSERKKELLLEIGTRPIFNIHEWIKSFKIGLQEGRNPELKNHQSKILDRLSRANLTPNDKLVIREQLGHINLVKELFGFKVKKGEE